MRWAALALALLAGMAAAAPPPQAEREIGRLIDALGSSGCRFQRNGDWHDAKAAQEHLRRKYDYLRRRELVASAEQFIERAATRSSMSGKPYTVRCGGRAEEPSAQWLGRQLQALRRATSPSP
ncbi:MAG TPA: DUF5329 domain-containing protein [Lysobacter sp.]|nr:DUF5329 domain-containing protein [Lysobacter sp.]